MHQRRQGSNSNFIDFSTNDYLNLSRDPQLLKAGYELAKALGAGATGSRLLSGNFAAYEEFEHQIAQAKGLESALLFNSGFQANLSVLSTLLDPQNFGQKPLVFFDKLNHASLYQALFLTKPELQRYRHNDLAHLRQLLEKSYNNHQTKFLITETVFGMDGDFAPLTELVTLAEEFNLFIYLDEAHATGLFGKNGYGLSTLLNLKSLPHLVMGTFSKALGGAGAYIACHQELKDFIINKSPGFIYSTAPAPFSVGAASAAWQLLPQLENNRQKLLSLAKKMRIKLKELGFTIGTTESHIIPIIFGNENSCLNAQQQLLKAGLLLSCVRPPTVPPNSSRLRVALTAAHNHNDVDTLIDALRRL